jgi:uncharacterized protein DUF5709
VRLEVPLHVVILPRLSAIAVGEDPEWPCPGASARVYCVTDSIWERDDYEHDDDGIIDPEDELSEDSRDLVLEQGYSPPERPLGIDKFGTTLAEEREGETLDQRLAEEEPDPNMTVDLVEGEPAVRAGEGGDVPDDIDLGSGDVPDDVFDEGVVDDGEVGDARAGRLVDPEAGGTGDTEKDLVGYDVGIDGAAASAEEAAVHVVDYTEADAAIERDETERPTLGTS